MSRKFNSQKVLDMAEDSPVNEIPEGLHVLKIYQAKVVESGDEVSFMINCQAGGGWSNFFFRLSGFSDKANNYGQVQLAKLSVAVDVPELDLDEPTALIGKSFRALVEVEEYNGKLYRKLKRIEALPANSTPYDTGRTADAFPNEDIPF